MSGGEVQLSADGTAWVTDWVHMRWQEEEERRAAKQRRRELHMLPQLQAEVAAQEVESQRRQQRRATIRAEKALAGPGHLGKLKYLPPAVQVGGCGRVSRT